MKEYEGMYFDDSAEKDFMDFIIRANYRGDRVIIIYKKGWEDFTGYHGGDGLHPSIYVGKSTGPEPIPLSICRCDSTGGAGLLTCKKAIQSYYVK